MSADNLCLEFCELRDEIKKLRQAIAGMDNDRSYNVEEAAAFLMVHPQQVRIETRIGALPSTRIGKRYTYTKADLISFRERRKKHMDSPLSLRQVK
jgi:hypothetical protein